MGGVWVILIIVFLLVLLSGGKKKSGPEGRAAGSKQPEHMPGIDPKDNTDLPACPYNPHLSIMYNFLSPLLRELYGLMYEALRAGKYSVTVPRGLKQEEITFLVDCIYNEAPELCAYDRWNTTVVDHYGETILHLAYKRPISEQERFIREVDELSRQFAGKTEEQGIRAICNYLISRFSYGFADGVDTQLAYDALQTNKAVCNGYAQCAVMFAHFAGYPCCYINGSVYDEAGKYQGGHAWNATMFGDRYFWFDTTWNDSGSVPLRSSLIMDTRQIGTIYRVAPGYQCIPYSA